MINSKITDFKGTIRSGDTYKSGVTAPMLPLGIGYHAKINRLSFGAELGIHYAFTDFIDGISTRYSKYNDVLAFLTFTLSYQIFDTGCKCRVIWN
ncbi:MAG: hypothetical protein LBS07_00145 [Prevotellaceae bacterium]|nr:hypothetical protein [Prevotellaceae bacterium]